MADKVSKDSVDYSRGMYESHCGPTFRDDKGYCKHFISGAGVYGTCEEVRGTIDPIMWCTMFKKAKK